MQKGDDERSAVEDFLYHEAAILDDWDLDAWLDLMCDDAIYLVPPNEAHAEYPPSRTRRLITNIRILKSSGRELTVTSNFSVHRFRRGGKGGVYIGRYVHRLQRVASGFRIAERRVILDAEELGALGAVSFIL